MYQIVNLFLETWLTKTDSNGKSLGKLSNQKMPKGKFPDVRIYVALTLLHAPDTPNMFLNNHHTSSHPFPSKSCPKFPMYQKKYTKEPGTNLGFF